MSVLAAWAPAIITVITAIFIAGKIAGRIQGQESTLLRHENQLGEHEDRLNEHAVKIATSQAWQDGYKAGKDKN